MKTLRIAQAALAMTLAIGINSTTYAFMAVATDQPADVNVTLSEMVESFRLEIKAGTTQCEDMLAKLDAALADIDAKLDAGVENEEEHLAARDAIASMRYDLECLGQKLTLNEGMPIADGGFASVPGPVVSGGGGGGGGGGGSSVGGSGTFGRLFLAGGIAAAIAVPLASDGDNAGPVASDSIAN